MKTRVLIAAVVSTLSLPAFADNDSAEIQKAIQLLEQKGYQVEPLTEPKKIAPAGISLKSSQNGNFDAFISADLGRTRYKNSDYSADEIFSDANKRITDSSYNVRASFAYQDPSKLGVQFDTVFSKDDMKLVKLSTLDLAGHAFYRNDKYLIGLFGQYKQPKWNSKEFGDESADLALDFLGQAISREQVFLGGEAQAYFGDLTLSGQLAHQKFINQKNFISNEGLIYKDGVVASAKANYFMNDNWKLTGGYSYNNNNLNYLTLSDLSYDTHRFSLGTEYRLTNYPMSFYGDYVHNNFKLDLPSECGDCTSSLKSNALMVGMKINFGSESLKTRDRSGASLDPVPNNKGFADYFGALVNRGSEFVF